MDRIAPLALKRMQVKRDAGAMGSNNHRHAIVVDVDIVAVEAIMPKAPAIESLRLCDQSYRPVWG